MKWRSHLKCIPMINLLLNWHKLGYVSTFNFHAYTKHSGLVDWKRLTRPWGSQLCWDSELKKSNSNFFLGVIFILSKGVLRLLCTLGGIASICFRFHFQQKLRMHTHGCQGCQKTRNFERNSKILIARSTIQPKLSKIKNNLPFFKEFSWIS